MDIKEAWKIFKKDLKKETACAYMSGLSLRSMTAVLIIGNDISYEKRINDAAIQQTIGVPSEAAAIVSRKRAEKNILPGSNIAAWKEKQQTYGTPYNEACAVCDLVKKSQAVKTFEENTGAAVTVTLEKEDAPYGGFFYIKFNIEEEKNG